MSEQPNGPTIPEWDLADRMKKALRHAELPAGEMAEYLGVGRNTVSTWINGRIEPSTQTLRLWALRCGVPYEWLRDGIGASSQHNGGIMSAGTLTHSGHTATAA